MPEFFKKNLLTPPHLLPKPHDMLEIGEDPETNSNLAEDPLSTPHSEVNQPISNFSDSELLKQLLTWKAPSRPFRRKDRSYYTTVAILIILISAIAFLFGEKLLIGALVALGFVIYVLNFIPPEEIDYKLSTQGVTIGDHFYHWQELDSFWFSQKDGHTILNILTHLRFPSLLMLVLSSTNEEEVKKICARFLPFHEIAPKSLLDKWSAVLQKHFPLENPQR